MINLLDYLQCQMDWSLITFGNTRRTEGLCKHISKELEEIREAPDDLMEWIDVIILAFDGAWRSGHTPDQIVNALVKKQKINFERTWTRVPDDEPSEHQREKGDND